MRPYATIRLRSEHPFPLAREVAAEGRPTRVNWREGTEHAFRTKRRARRYLKRADRRDSLAYELRAEAEAEAELLRELRAIEADFEVYLYDAARVEYELFLHYTAPARFLRES